MTFDKQFDVIVLKLPIGNPKWSLDEYQNTLRLDLLAESPSFVIVGCGSTI